MTTIQQPWHVLERWSSTLFLIGGAVVVGYALLFGVEAISTTTMPKSVVAGIGYTLVFAGLLGMYPGIADRSPKLARAGAVCAVLGAVGFVGVFVVNVGQLSGIVPTPGPIWLDIVNLPAIVGMIPGFLIFGVAGLRTEVYSRSVGLLLLAPAVIFTANFVAVVVAGSGNVSPWWSLLITLGEALAILGIGYRIRIEGVPTTRMESSGDPAL